jgi:hypothetical protein
MLAFKAVFNEVEASRWWSAHGQLGVTGQRERPDPLDRFTTRPAGDICCSGSIAVVTTTGPKPFVSNVRRSPSMALT